MQDVRRLAWDLSLFTTSEFDFVRLPEQYTTGSSIMPNKSNPDVVELLRGRAATPAAAISEIQATLSLPSGYQRDLQLTKAPLIRGMRAALQALAIVPALVRGLQFNQQKMRDAISKEMFATDLALEQAVHAGVPFRSAYLAAKRELDQIDSLILKPAWHNALPPGLVATCNWTGFAAASSRNWRRPGSQSARIETIFHEYVDLVLDAQDQRPIMRLLSG